MQQLVDVSHLSKRGSSLRMTIPRKVQAKLGDKEEDILEFYEENGKIVLKKMEYCCAEALGINLYWSYFFC